jgi:integrase/recombinase XerD
MNNNYDNVLKIYREKLKYLNYSDRTGEIYVHYTQKFILSIDKPIQHFTSNDFKTYLESYPYTSTSQQNQIINALRFLYREVLGKKYEKVSFKRPKKEKHLPKVIDQNHILKRIDQISNLKHKAIISLVYSVGLRVSEVINMKISDIDSGRMIITIRQGKGKKDRIVPLSQKILELLRTYYKFYKPKEYLFNGQTYPKYSAESCNQIIKKYLGIQYHFHMLRHSCFTSLLESGTDLRVIQKIAGHSSSKTTEIYTHVSNHILQQVKLPI